MNENYTYPAILDYSEPGVVTIEFPDVNGAFTDVEEGESIIQAAQDVLALSIKDYEDSHIELPTPSESLTVNENQKLIYVNVWMPYHRNKIKEVYVKKTLTIPAWLDVLAKSNNINFSAVLVEGLKKKLNIE